MVGELIRVLSTGNSEWWGWGGRTTQALEIRKAWHFCCAPCSLRWDHSALAQELPPMSTGSEWSSPLRQTRSRVEQKELQSENENTFCIVCSIPFPSEDCSLTNICSSRNQLSFKCSLRDHSAAKRHHSVFLQYSPELLTFLLYPIIPSSVLPSPQPNFP